MSVSKGGFDVCFDITGPKPCVAGVMTSLEQQAIHDVLSAQRSRILSQRMPSSEKPEFFWLPQRTGSVACRMESFTTEL